MGEDLYSILGVTGDATTEQVVAAYRRLAKAAHPDAGGSAEEFQRISHAYRVLRDPTLRARYDATGRVDDDALKSTRERVVGFLRDLFQTYLQQGCASRKDLSVIDSLAGATRRLLDQRREHIDGKRREIDDLEALRATIQRKDEGVNVFAHEIDKHLRELRQQIAQVELEVETAEQALDELGHYKSFPRMARGVFWQTPKSSTTDVAFTVRP